MSEAMGRFLAGPVGIAATAYLVTEGHSVAAVMVALLTVMLCGM